MPGDQISTMFVEMVTVAKMSGLEAPLVGLFCTSWRDNGREVALKINGAGAERDLLPPFHASLMIDGWPAVIASPAEGVVTGYTEDDAIDLLRRRIAELQQPTSDEDLARAFVQAHTK